MLRTPIAGMWASQWLHFDRLCIHFLYINPLRLKSTVSLKYFFPYVIWVPNSSNVVQKVYLPLIRPLVKKIIIMDEFVHEPPQRIWWTSFNTFDEIVHHQNGRTTYNIRCISIKLSRDIINPCKCQHNDSRSHRIDRSCSNCFRETDNI